MERLKKRAATRRRLGSAPEWFREALERIAVAPIYTHGGGRPINALGTTDAFRNGAYPISARPFGLAWNPFYSPLTSTLDLRVMKTIPLRNDRIRLQFGVESFNLLNHSNPIRVNQSFAAGSDRLRSYGETLESLCARPVQFLMHVEW